MNQELGTNSNEFQVLVKDTFKPNDFNNNSLDDDETKVLQRSNSEQYKKYSDCEDNLQNT